MFLVFPRDDSASFILSLLFSFATNNGTLYAKSEEQCGHKSEKKMKRQATFFSRNAMNAWKEKKEERSFLHCVASIVHAVDSEQVELICNLLDSQVLDIVFNDLETLRMEKGDLYCLSNRVMQF